MEPLKPLAALTEPDVRWAFCGLTLPKLHKIVQDMTLGEHVPEYVQLQFQQAQHLLVYSHLQYSLITVALTQALISVELALSTRWKNDPTRQLGKHKGLPGLKKLLEIAFEKGWLPGFKNNLISTLTILRNAAAHGEYTLEPIGTLEIVATCGKLIQQIFPIVVPIKED